MNLRALFLALVALASALSAQERNLYRIDLTGRQQIGGFDIGYDGWSVAPNFDPDWLEHGYDGLEIIGDPAGTHVLPAVNSAGYTDDVCVRVDASAEYVRFVNLVFHCGSREGLLLGPTSSRQDEPKFLQADFERCEWVTDGDATTKWAIMSYQAGVSFVECRATNLRCVEHLFYEHGMAWYGVLVDSCYFQPTQVAELLKVATRPSAQYYPEGVTPGKHAKIDAVHPARGPNGERPTLHVRDSFLSGWDSGASMKGAGIVLQGSDANLWVQRSVVINTSGAHAIGIEGSYEQFGPSGVATEKPGNGWVLLEDSLLLSPTDSQWFPPLVRVNDAESVIINDCGIWGSNTKVSLEDMPADAIVSVEGVGSPELRELAEGYMLTEIQERGLSDVTVADLLGEPLWVGGWPE